MDCSKKKRLIFRTNKRKENYKIFQVFFNSSLFTVNYRFYSNKPVNPYIIFNPNTISL